MSQQLDELTAKMNAHVVVVDTAVELLNGLKERLDAALASSDPPAALQALSVSLGAETQKLSDAIAANTPAA